MPDFLRGMMSSRPIRDYGMEGMRDAAIGDFRTQLRQRRAQKSLQGLLQGDPKAQLDLAAIGIGAPPETPEQRSKREQARSDALKARGEDVTYRKERFAWEKEARQKGLDQQKELTEAGRVDTGGRFKEEMEFKKSQAEQAKADREAERSESRRRWDVGQKWKQKDWDRVERRDTIIDSYRASQETRAQESHDMEQAINKYRFEKTVNKDAMLPDVISNQAANYLPMPQMPREAKRNPEVQRQYQKDLDRWRQDMVKSVVNVKKAIDSGLNYDQAMDIVFPNQRLREAATREVEAATIQQMEQQRQQDMVKLQAEREQRLEAQKERGRETLESRLSPHRRVAMSGELEKEIAPLERKGDRRTPPEETRFQDLLRRIRDLQNAKMTALESMQDDVRRLIR